MSQPEFRKALAIFYHKWFRDSCDSVVYCEQRGDYIKADEYRKSVLEYFDIIINNWDAVEFFSVGHNAFLSDRSLPKEFQGYR